jgi:hypothetical protein
MVLLKQFEILPLLFGWQELLMNNLEGVTDSVVLPLKGSKTCQDRIVNALDKDHLLERIIVLRSIIPLIPGVDGILRHLIWVLVMGEVSGMDLVHHQVDA